MYPVSPSVGDYSLALRAVAAYGLAGSMLELPPSELVDRDFLRLHARIREQRLTGLFWSAITDGVFPVTESQRDRAEESHLRVLAGILRLEQLLVDTVGTLKQAGVPVRALKGAAVAHLDYPDPAQRTFGDIDLFVPSTAFDDAVAVLKAAGCIRRYPEPRPGFDRRFGKGTCLCTPAGLEIDLHRTFSMGPFGERLALDELWERSESFTLAGTTVETLPVEARFLHAAYHAELGDLCPRLAPLRDLAQIVLTAEFDWARLQSLMQASQGEAVVARSVRTAWQEFHLADVLAVSAWASQYREDEQAAADLSLYTLTPSYAARAFATVRAIPSLSEKARFVAALTMPERSYLDGRHSSRPSRLRQGVTEILRGRSKS